MSSIHKLPPRRRTITIDWLSPASPHPLFTPNQTHPAASTGPDFDTTHATLQLTPLPELESTWVPFGIYDIHDAEAGIWIRCEFILDLPAWGTIAQRRGEARGETVKDVLRRQHARLEHERVDKYSVLADVDTSFSYVLWDQASTRKRVYEDVSPKVCSRSFSKLYLSGESHSNADRHQSHSMLSTPPAPPPRTRIGNSLIGPNKDEIEEFGGKTGRFLTS